MGRNESSLRNFTSSGEGELSLLLVSDKSMKKDVEVGAGEGARGSSETSLEGDVLLSKLGKRGKPSRRGTPLIVHTFWDAGVPSPLTTDAGPLVESTGVSDSGSPGRFQNLDRMEDRNEGACEVCALESMTIGVDMLRTCDEMARNPEWKNVE
jgi:hypothetical protein